MYSKIFKPAVMKIFTITLLSVAFFFSGISKSRAQCTVSDIFIQNVTVLNALPNSCTVKFDVTFNIDNNNGNKFIFVHAWLQNEYPNYFQCVNGQTTQNGSIRAPAAADLGNVFFSIGINNDGAVPAILTSYPPDAGINMAVMDSSFKIVLPDGSANITLYGVVATAPVPCGTPVVIVADLWSSQSATAQRAHCVNCGLLFSAGYLNVNGFVNCLNLTYTGSISNNTPLSISGYYRVFADVNGDGYFTPVTDTLLKTNTLFTLGPNGSTGISGTIPGANLNQNIFIVVTQTTGNASGASRVFLFSSTQCSPLPVSFRSFTAVRTSRTEVNLRWETATEDNNSGFLIWRNAGNNNWEAGSFVPSQAMGGNSNQLLTYTINDRNANKGITQYRIKQVDINGNAKLSEIRIVAGNEQQQEIIVFPNPSDNGSMTVLFQGTAESRDIRLINGSGQIIQQWSGVSKNSLQIDNLQTGMFTLIATERGTGLSSSEKIIVLKY
jgi:Secretion system C-terminal sorting domain